MYSKGACIVALLLTLSLLACAREPVGGPVPTATTQSEGKGAVSQPSPAGVEVSSGGLVEKMTLEKLTTLADAVVVGVVAEAESRWNEDKTLIVTDVHVRVQETIGLQESGDTIKLVVPGGQVGEITQMDSTAPTFTVGERVLLFLARAEKDTYQVVGGFQGKHVIEGETVMDLGAPLSEVLARIRAMKR